jgi:hypothetical protein
VLHSLLAEHEAVGLNWSFENWSVVRSAPVGPDWPEIMDRIMNRSPLLYRQLFKDPRMAAVLIAENKFGVFRIMIARD